MAALTVIACTDDWIAIDKPAGIGTVPAHGKPSVLEQLQHQLQCRSVTQKLWIVHRLDAAASGILLFARNAETHRALCMAWEAGEVHKTYHVATEVNTAQLESSNRPLPVEGYIAEGRKGAMRVGRSANDPLFGGKPSRFARVHISAVSPGHLCVKTEQGRRHQVRLLCALAGFPVAGDHQYYPVAGLPYGRSCESIGLRATEISFQLRGHSHMLRIA